MKMPDIIDVFASTIEEKIGEEWKHEVCILGTSYDHCNFEIDGKEYVLVVHEVEEGHHFSQFLNSI